MTDTFTLELTFSGKTKPVTFKTITLGGNDGSRAYNNDAFACQIGRGQKVYQANVSAWRVDDPNAKWLVGYGRPTTPVVTDADGTQWAVNLSRTVVRNRQAHVVGWAEDFFGTVTATAHDDYSALRRPAPTADSGPT